MKLGTRLTIIGAAGALAGLLGIAPAIAQTAPTAPPQKPPLSQNVFKDVQVLQNMPEDQFMATMGFFSASLGANCTFCHVNESGGNWARYADETPNKEMARKMYLMMNNIDKTYFGGQQLVTCYSCHRGDEKPRAVPNLAEVYGPAPSEDPNRIIEQQQPDEPQASAVLDKYIDALGGAQKLAQITSFTAKATYQGYGELDRYPVDIFAKAPDQRTVILHTPNGNRTETFNGKGGWVSAPSTDQPVPVMELTGGNLDGAYIEAALSFPSDIKNLLTNWRVGYPETIDGHEVQNVQGFIGRHIPVHLYFDTKTGLLTRLVWYATAPVGLYSTQLDYSDYRDVNGVKVPFHVVRSWLDGRFDFVLTDIQFNTPIDASHFVKPKAPAPVSSASR